MWLIKEILCIAYNPKFIIYFVFLGMTESELLNLCLHAVPYSVCFVGNGFSECETICS